jgi:hypothetical protein
MTSEEHDGDEEDEGDDASEEEDDDGACKRIRQTSLRQANQQRKKQSVEIVIVTIGISTFLLHSLVIVIGKWI